MLDAVCSQISLGRRLFEVGVERGFYAKVSRLGEQWLELDLHFLSLGGGEIALGWWFEECLVPYLTDTDKLNSVKSISIVTGYGKTRTRGRRNGDDGMRKRCRAMLRFMGITEQEQPNLGRIHIDKDSLIELVKRNGGRIIFDLDGYLQWKEEETRANTPPDVEQKIRARFKPTIAGSGGPPFTRVESEYTSDEYRLENHEARMAKLRAQDLMNESEMDGDADYNDNTFHRRPEVPMGRLGNGRGVPDEGRDFRRVETEKFDGLQGARAFDTETSHGFVDRGGPINQQSDAGFHRTNQPDNYTEKRFSGADYGDHMGRKTNGFRRYDGPLEHEQRLDGRLQHHGRSRDQPYDDQGIARLQGVDDNFGVANSGNPHRQRIDDYGDQRIGSRDFEVDNCGNTHYLHDEVNVIDTRQLPRGDEIRNQSLGRGFQGSRESWQRNDNASNQVMHTQYPEIGQRGRGRAEEISRIESNSFPYDHHSHGRGDDSAYRDASSTQSQRFYSSTDPYEGDAMHQYRNEDARIAENEIQRKRQHTDSSTQSLPLGTQGDRIPIPNSGRGYALEPDTQRRRLS